MQKRRERASVLSKSPFGAFAFVHAVPTTVILARRQQQGNFFSWRRRENKKGTKKCCCSMPSTVLPLVTALHSAVGARTKNFFSFLFFLEDLLLSLALFLL